MKKILFSLLLALLGISALFAADKRVYVSKHINPHAPAIDGRGDDPCWEKAEWAGGFTQDRPALRRGAQRGHRVQGHVRRQEPLCPGPLPRQHRPAPSSAAWRAATTSTATTSRSTSTATSTSAPPSASRSTPPASRATHPLRRQHRPGLHLGPDLVRQDRRSTPTAGRPRWPSPSASCASPAGTS